MLLAAAGCSSSPGGATDEATVAAPAVCDAMAPVVVEFAATADELAEQFAAGQERFEAAARAAPEDLDAEFDILVGELDTVAVAWAEAGWSPDGAAGAYAHMDTEAFADSSMAVIGWLSEHCPEDLWTNVVGSDAGDADLDAPPAGGDLSESYKVVEDPLADAEAPDVEAPDVDGQVADTTVPNRDTLD